VSVDKDYYSTFQQVKCRFSGFSKVKNEFDMAQYVEGYWANEQRYIRIVKSSQLNKRNNSMNDLTD
jgi:hypothetical protein